MRIETEDFGEVRVISLNGRLMGDQADLAEFLDTVKAALYNNRKKLVFDFEGVEWMNSSGLGMIIAGNGLVREVEGGLVRLAKLNDSVSRLIGINRLNLVFEIHLTVDAAVKSLTK
jgi:anti-anti-sigma factor